MMAEEKKNCTVHYLPHRPQKIVKTVNFIYLTTTVKLL